jgi:hypothetical protein
MNSRNVFHFSLYDLKMTSKLLAAYRDPILDHTIRLGNKITPEINKTSGFCFLIDSDFHVARLDTEGKFLLDWFICDRCSTEGFAEMLREDGRDCCRSYLENEIAKFRSTQ